MRFLLTLAAGFGAYWWLHSRREKRAPYGRALSPGRVSPAAPGAGAGASAGKGAKAGDDLTRIKGIGPKLAAALEEIGIHRFDQIAGWSGADVAAIDARLVQFKGRIERDDWIGQAKALASSTIH